ncbi:unnamed protein product, partial [marine sediment metagenome]
DILRINIFQKLKGGVCYALYKEKIGKKQNRSIIIFYVYVRKDKLLFDSKFSDEFEESLYLDKIERPESAHIIHDNIFYYAVKNEGEIIKLLNFSYSKIS